MVRSMPKRSKILLAISSIDTCVVFSDWRCPPGASGDRPAPAPSGIAAAWHNGCRHDAVRGSAPDAARSMVRPYSRSLYGTQARGQLQLVKILVGQEDNWRR